MVLTIVLSEVFDEHRPGQWRLWPRDLGATASATSRTGPSILAAK